MMNRFLLKLMSLTGTKISTRIRTGTRTGTMKAKTRFLVEAKKHLGVNGRPNQFTRWYAKEVAKDDNFLRAPWCDMFVSYVAHTVGLSREVGRYAYCPYHVDWFKKNKQWGSTPRVGAIAFMDWDGDGRADHVGIVESFNGNTVVTIEGNKGNAVQRVVRTNGIMGYGYPRYPGDSVPKTHTVQRGDSLSGIALHYYSDYSRWRDIYKTNRKLIGNDPALIKPGMRLTLPKA